MTKISTLYVYIKKVCHYNKWSLKINLFTKVFIKRSVLIFGRTQPFFLRLCTYVFWAGMISFSGWQSVDINFFKMFWSCLAVHLLNLFLERSVKQQAHYISELATLVLMSPGSRIEMLVAVNVLLNSTVNSMCSF